MKRIILLLLVGLLLLPSVVGQSCGVADDSQLIFRISAPDNAHAELWNGAGGYPEEICYNIVFGAIYPPAGGTEHDCAIVVGNPNNVLQLSTPTNAHVEMYGLPNYPVDVCFGNLFCDIVGGGNPCSDFDLTAQCLGSISAITNAHVSSACNGAGSYPNKICCTSTPPASSCPCLVSLDIDPSNITETDSLSTAQVTLTNLDDVNPRTVDLVVRFIDLTGADVRGADLSRPNLDVAPSATRTEDISLWINSPTLPVGSYQITAIVTDSVTGLALGTQSVILVVVSARATPVPELGTILLPLIGISVIVVLFLASEKEKVTGFLRKKKKKPKPGKKPKAKKKPKRKKPRR
jgi:hypothetical protein